MFEHTKGELVMDHFEVRQYRTIQRHLVLSAVRHLFLAEFGLAERGKKSGADGRPGPHGHGGPRGDLDAGRTLLEETRRGHLPPPFSAQTTKRAPPAATDGESCADGTKKRVRELRDNLTTMALVA
jgi:hypothetical protein